jgi:hypothetical protein
MMKILVLVQLDMAMTRGPVFLLEGVDVEEVALS